jgi:polyisoprenoid-binding protein YceI
MEIRTSRLVGSLLIWQIATTYAIGAEPYAVDPAHTSVVFSIGHLKSMGNANVPVSYTYGMFRKLGGNFVLDRANPAGCQFQFAIDAGSIDTNDVKRDEHLKSPDFFNAREFPQISFQSTACELTQQPDGKLVYNLTGNLSLLGETRQVTLPVEFIGEGESPFGDYRLGFHSQFTLKRSDFGMAGMTEMVGDAVGITVSIEGIRQEENTVQPASATIPANE